MKVEDSDEKDDTGKVKRSYGSDKSIQQNSESNNYD